MFEFKTIVPKTARYLLSAPPSQGSNEPKQRRMMVVALTLLLITLGFVLYRDRDFWFPETQEAADRPMEVAPAATVSTPMQVVAESPAPKARKKPHSSKAQPKPAAPVDAASEASKDAPPMSVTTTRTVLPPLEVEVVAGDSHRTLRPGSNSVNVDLQAGAPPQKVSEATNISEGAETGASVTNAAERVQMSSDAAEVVSSPVKPDYPLLARQMKVQGSVILQALIGRDGLIQDLRVLSGPPILASAAQEAVKQWHFKPHYQGADTVETQAKITVNFTISTN